MSPIGSFARSEGFALVTGANRGIGLEVAKLLAQKGKRVIVGVRQSSAGAPQCSRGLGGRRTAS